MTAMGPECDMHLETETVQEVQPLPPIDREEVLCHPDLIENFLFHLRTRCVNLVLCSKAMKQAYLEESKNWKDCNLYKTAIKIALQNSGGRFDSIFIIAKGYFDRDGQEYPFTKNLQFQLFDFEHVEWVAALLNRKLRSIGFPKFRLIVEFYRVHRADEDGYFIIFSETSSRYSVYVSELMRQHDASLHARCLQHLNISE
jgi:hypothetical protein